MNKDILKDNLLYIHEWMNVNPKLKEGLSINGTLLCYQDENDKLIQDISNFYLPQMLYNETFREKLTQDLTARDLFRIIKVYCETEEIMQKNELEDLQSPKILDLEMKTDNNGKEFLTIKTEDNKIYRFDTLEPEKMINLYLETKNKNKTITLKQFGRLVKNAK